MNDDEVRVVDEATGGEKGSKLARFGLIPPDVMWELAEHYGRGSQKYDDRNWQKGYKWSLSYDALQRHLHQWLMGFNRDEETGTRHIVAVIWHAVALAWFQAHGVGTDDIRALVQPKEQLFEDAERVVEETNRNLAAETRRHAPWNKVKRHKIGLHWTEADF